jgi:hypothetical protein
MKVHFFGIETLNSSQFQEYLELISEGDGTVSPHLGHVEDQVLRNLGNDCQTPSS